MDLISVLSTIRAYFDEAVKKIADKYELKEMEYHILAYLGQNSAKNSAAEIVKALRATKSHISISVKSLTEKGYIHQFHSNNNNKTISLELTEMGEKIYKESISGFDDYLKQVSIGFSKEEIDTFSSLLNRLYTNSLEGLKKK